VVLACATLAAACSSGSGKGNTGGNGSQGSAGTTGAAGNTAGSAGSSGAAGDTAGSAGNPGNGGSATGNGGTTSGAGGTTSGSGGTTSGNGGTGGSSSSRGGTTGTGGTGGATAGSAGAGGTTGAGGTVVTTGMAGTFGVGGAPPTCMSPIAITSGTASTVTATLTTTVRASFSPDFYGIHTSVYDGNMQLPTTPEWLKTAGITSLRWPGGSYADLYHWSTNTGTWTPASGAGSNTIFIADDTDFGHFLVFMEKVGEKALITVNYGMNATSNGPGEPKEAAAMVAYANGSPTSTQSIGADSKGNDWKTVGYWASLRAAATTMPTDDGFNKFRINHPAPFNIKYWEIGNELYGNGYYYGGCGWEADMHVNYPSVPDGGTANCTGRQNASALSPMTYGNAVKSFATAMKAVDSSIKIGGIVVGTSGSEYSNPPWNSMVLGAGCSSMDFVSLHWYAPANTSGITIQNVSTVPETEIPPTFTRVRNALTAANCPGGANMPIAVTEWGPNTNNGAGITIPKSTATAAPVGSQVLGLFAAEAYANFLEQGVLAAHWLELHNNSYLAGVDATNDPFTTANDTPRWGYKGELMAHWLAMGGDKIVQAAQSGTFGAALKVHAAVHANDDVAVMMTNTNRNVDANVTLNIAGGNIGCVGTRYAYTPVNTDQDGNVSSDWIYANSAGTSVPVLVPRYSTVVVVFPKK